MALGFSWPRGACAVRPVTAPCFPSPQRMKQLEKERLQAAANQVGHPRARGQQAGPWQLLRMCLRLGSAAPAGAELPQGPRPQLVALACCLRGSCPRLPRSCSLPCCPAAFTKCLSALCARARGGGGSSWLVLVSRGVWWGLREQSRPHGPNQPPVLPCRPTTRHRPRPSPSASAPSTRASSTCGCCAGNGGAGPWEQAAPCSQARRVGKVAWAQCPDPNLHLPPALWPWPWGR